MHSQGLGGQLGGLRRIQGSEKIMKREQIVVQTKHSLMPLMVSIYWAPAISIYLQRFNNKVYENVYATDTVTYFLHNCEG